MSVVYMKIRSLIDRMKFEFVPEQAMARVREIESVAGKSSLPLPNDDFQFVAYWAEESVNRWKRQLRASGGIY